MGSSDDGKSTKSEKSSPPATEQNNVQVYPDWAAMQAYYGPRVPLPPYYNSAVASGHPPPPYMWGPPQPMMPPYAAPYAAIYAHGGVYAHTGVPLSPQVTGAGGFSTAVTTPLSIGTPAKSPGNTDKGLMKKLKGFDGLAMSIGNGNAKKADIAAENNRSLSTESEGSSDGSDGNTEEADRKKRKRSRESIPSNAGESGRSETKPTHRAAEKVLGVHMIQAAVTSNMTSSLELSNPGVDIKGSSAAVHSVAVVSPETWLQSERELKRERRKQSNRESARRSRLRKQAETEELARRVESLSAENMALKSEMNQLVDSSQKLRNENAILMGKLKNLQPGEVEDGLAKVDVKRNPSDSTENLLSRINNSGSAGRNSEEDNDTYERSSKSSGKFHQLLRAKPRADAVAAG